MNDPAMNNLLKWGIQNSGPAANDPNASQRPPTQLDPRAVAQLFGLGEGLMSDPDKMKDCMNKIDEKDEAGKDDKDKRTYSLEDKRLAFQDFLMLIEQIDNANNIAGLGLWDRLLAQLQHDNAEFRMYAASCTGVAVENNIKAQERLLVLGAVPTLVKLATEDRDPMVRKKAIGALSKFARNFQPGLDTIVQHVPPQFKPKDRLDAGDMSSVDSLINSLREHAAQA